MTSVLYAGAVALPETQRGSMSCACALLPKPSPSRTLLIPSLCCPRPPPTSPCCSQGRLPVKWMAPEALFDRIYTHQSDV